MSITVSFNCENHNDVILLTTLFDILTVKNIDDSNAMIFNTAWLVEEIGDRLIEIDEINRINDDEGEHNLSGLSLMVANICRNLLDRKEDNE
jgi:hypothetical protein